VKGEIHMNRGRVGEEREVRKQMDVPLQVADIDYK
jgi:hypothetical protein